MQIISQKTQKYLLPFIFLLTFLWFLREANKILISLPFWGDLKLFKFSLTVSTLIFMTGFFLKKNFTQICILSMAILIIASCGIVPLISILLLFLSSQLIGGEIFRFIKITENDQIHSLIKLALGLGIYVTFIGLLSYFPINTKWFYAILLILPILVFYNKIKILFKELAFYIEKINKLLLIRTTSVFVIFSALFLYLIVSLMPDFGNDALAQHLFIPSFIKSHQQWFFDVENYIWACWPSNGDWLSSILYVLGGEASAKLGIFSSLLILLALFTATITRFISEDHSLLGAIILLMLPVTYLEISTVFVEYIWTIFLLCGILMTLFFSEKHLKSYIYIACVFFGIALATKMITMAILIIFVPLILFLVFKIKPKEYKKISLFCLFILLLFGIEPYLISFIKTGNPVFPLYNNIFKSEFFAPIHFNNPLYQSSLNLLSLRDATFYSGRFIEGSSGALGFVFFMMLPISVAINFIYKAKYSQLLLLFLLIFVFIVFQMQSYLRYIYPAYPLIIFFILQAINSIKINMIFLYNFMVLSVWTFILVGIPFFLSCTQAYRDFSVNALFNPIGRYEFIKKYSPVRAAVIDLNKELNTSSRVAFFSNPFAAGLNGYAIYANWYNNNFILSVYAAKTKYDLVKILDKYHIDAIVLDENFNPGGGFPHIVPFLKDITEFKKDYGQGITTRFFNKNKN